MFGGNLNPLNWIGPGQGSSQTHSDLNPAQIASQQEYFDFLSGQMPGYENFMGDVTNTPNQYTPEAFNALWNQNIKPQVAESLQGALSGIKERGGWKSSANQMKNTAFKDYGKTLGSLKSRLEMDRINKSSQWLQKQQGMIGQLYAGMTQPGYYGGTQSTAVTPPAPGLGGGLFPGLYT